jgi:hypothetical protein
MWTFMTDVRMLTLSVVFAMSLATVVWSAEAPVPPAASTFLYDLGFTLDPLGRSDKNSIAVTRRGLVVPTPWGDFEASIVSTPVDRMVRVPLTPNADSAPRLLPYVTAGTRKDVDDDPVLEQARAAAFADSSRTNVKAGAGVIWRLDENTEVFGEYQFMRLQRDLTGRGALGPIGTSLDASGFSLGVSIRY